MFLLSRLSGALVQTNPTNNVHITITVFFTYLLRLVPSDVQLFIRPVHIMTSVDCRAILGRAAEQGRIARNATD